MKGTRINYKYIKKYLGNVITYSIFVILVLCALALSYYFVSSRIIHKEKGDNPAFSIFTIVSPSMTPKIKVYDVIINTKVDRPQDIKVGDVITFKSTSPLSYGMTVTHRVKDIQIINGEYQYITQGDANTIADFAPALYSNVIGKAKVRLPGLGRIQLFVSSKFGWLVVVVIPALIVIISDIMKLVRISRIRKSATKFNEEMVNKTERRTLYGRK